jgi:hypothetical protein
VTDVFIGERITVADNGMGDLSEAELEVNYSYKSKCLAVGIFHLLNMPATIMLFAQTYRVFICTLNGQSSCTL